MHHLKGSIITSGPAVAGVVTVSTGILAPESFLSFMYEVSVLKYRQE
ncbi:MAG: hypothetical protein IPP30_14410 [Flavobacterium sp.]|nr:hypothetical protein [Flavobacterium sp.]